MKGLALLFCVALATGSVRGQALSGLQALTYKSGGIERSYNLYLPQGLPADAPLVFVLHGHGGSSDPTRYAMNPVADRYGFAVCYPQGVLDSKGKSCWNVGYPFQADMTINDVSFLCRLAHHLQKKFKLSRENTFCTGFSNGGEMCYLLAYLKPDVFAAVAPIAGLTLEWMYRAYESRKPIPVLEIHGTADKTSAWNGDLANKGGWGAYIAVPVAIAYWVASNRCTHELVGTLPVRDTTSNHRIITHKYVNGTHGNEVWLYEIVNGKHSWGEKDLNTSEEIWRFFSRFLKPMQRGLSRE